MKRIAHLGLVLLSCFILHAEAAGKARGKHVEKAPPPPPPPEYRIVQRLAHDTNAFTQGLLMWHGELYESSGIYGHSNLRHMHPGSTEATMVDLPARFFAEGITMLDDRLYTLTWKEGTLIIFNPETLAMQQTKRYTGEGWGLTSDGRHLIMSDGSDRITFRDPGSLSIMSTIEVRENSQPLSQLNELEWVNGKLLANVWHQSRIVVIDPATGEVTRSIDLTALAQEQPKTEDLDNVLNGMAWDPDSHTLWVTGKRWQYLYQLQVNGL